MSTSYVGVRQVICPDSSPGDGLVHPCKTLQAGPADDAQQHDWVRLRSPAACFPAGGAGFSREIGIAQAVAGHVALQSLMQVMDQSMSEMNGCGGQAMAVESGLARRAVY